jgi:hypothetical protein
MKILHVSDRPRKMLATAALSVPLLAAGSTVVFGSAAQAATVSPAHVSDGTPNGGGGCSCTKHPTTPPATPSPSTSWTKPGGCGCHKHPTPPPTTTTTAPPAPVPSTSTAPAPVVTSATPVPTTSPSAGVLPVGGAGTGGGGSTKGGSDTPLAAGGAAAAVAAGGIGFFAYRRYRKAQASA